MQQADSCFPCLRWLMFPGCHLLIQMLCSQTSHPGSWTVWRRNSAVAALAVNRIRSLRLIGELQQADELSHETEKAEVSVGLRLELEWESACRRATQDQILDRLLKMVQKGASHYQASYVLEFFFWALASPSFRWLNKMTKIRTLLRDESLGLKEVSTYYAIARDFERIYDDKANVTARLQTLGNILEKMHHCHSVDKQLLILAASCRWLLRNGIDDLFEFTRLEYISLCEKLSQKQSNDLLGMLSDCVSKV